MSDNRRYNASVYTVNGVTYRNLEAQVLKNKEDIEALDISGIEDDVEQLQRDVAALDADKQEKLTAGANVTISDENVISATNTTYSAGENIYISAGNVINATASPALLWVDMGVTTFTTISSALNMLNMLPVMFGTDNNLFVYNCDVVGDGGHYYHVFLCVEEDSGRIKKITVSDENVWSTESYIPSPGVQRYSITRTLAANAWASGSQRVAISGLLSNADVWVSPSPGLLDATNYDNFVAAKIEAYAQGTGYIDIRYNATSAPTSDIYLNIVYIQG